MSNGSPVILVINAGSATIKFSLHEIADAGLGMLRFRGLVQKIGAGGRFTLADGAGRRCVDQPLAPAKDGGALGLAQLLRVALDWLASHAAGLQLMAAGHRVVHGGTRYGTPVRVDAEVMEELRRLVPLAPLHQPHHLAAIAALGEMIPGLPQVACFDTSFHRTQPKLAQMYALPRWCWEEGIKAYGFHGLSYESVLGQLPAFLGQQAEGKLVIAHLGSGASACAIEHGKSVASSMGFTALDGLVMGTRCGSLDPGVVLHLLSERGMDLAGISDLLYRQSGLLGVSGISADMRELLESPAPEAAEAIALFVERIRRQIGALAAALQGLDALVFTGGIGEHAATIRHDVCAGLGWLGLELDGEANMRGESRISRAGSRVSAWVIHTDEDSMIARHTLSVLGASAPARTGAST
jgi:acetate kinase